MLAVGLDTQTELSLHFAAPLPASSHDPPILGSSAAKFDKAKRAARDAKKPAQQIQAQPPAQPKQSHPPSDLERTKRSSESSLPNHVEKRPRIVEDDDDDGEDRTENGRRPSAKAPSRHVAPHLLALLREKVPCFDRRSLIHFSCNRFVPFLQPPLCRISAHPLHRAASPLPPPVQFPLRAPPQFPCHPPSLLPLRRAILPLLPRLSPLLVLRHFFRPPSFRH